MNKFQALLCELFKIREQRELSWLVYEMDTCFGLCYFHEWSDLDGFKINALGNVTTLRIYVTKGVELELDSDNLADFEILQDESILSLTFEDSTVVAVSY